MDTKDQEINGTPDAKLTTHDGQTKTKQKKRPFIVFLILILLLVLLYSGGSFIPQSKNKSLPPSVPTPTTILYPTVPQVSATSSASFTVYQVLNNKPIQLVTIPLEESGAFGDIYPTIVDGNLYAGDGVNVYRYSPTDQSLTKIFTNTLSDYTIQSFSINQNGHLFVSLSPKDYYGSKLLFKVLEIDMSTGKTIRELNDIKHSFYGGITYLFPLDDADIIASFGGDGCGGWGVISSVKNGTQTELIKTGSGCGEDPRYVGPLDTKQQIILAAILPKSDNPEARDSYDVLFAYDVKSATKIPLYDLKLINGLIGLSMSNDKKSIALVSKSSVSLFDLNSNKITKTFPITLDDSTYITSFANDSLVLTKYGQNNKNTYTQMNTSTGAVKEFDMAPFTSMGISPTFTGLLNGTTLFTNYLRNYQN